MFRSLCISSKYVWSTPDAEKLQRDVAMDILRGVYIEKDTELHLFESDMQLKIEYEFSSSTSLEICKILFSCVFTWNHPTCQQLCSYWFCLLCLFTHFLMYTIHPALVNFHLQSQFHVFLQLVFCHYTVTVQPE